MRMPSSIPAGILTSSVFVLLDLALAVTTGAGLGNELAGTVAVGQVCCTLKKPWRICTEPEPWQVEQVLT
jgi:hypothetical protein